jgi:hypothetical protein
VEVELDGRGLPAVVRPRQDSRTAGTAAPRRVETIGEIWQVDDEWWRKPISRRYVEVMLEGGKHTVLYQDLVTGEWFEQRL